MVKSLFIAAVALVVIGGVAVAAPVPTIDPQQRHFDHDRHNAEMTKDGHPAPSCSTCHQIDDRSKVDWKIKSGWGSALSPTEHTRCFGACHGKSGDHDYHPECSSLSAGGGKSPAKVCAVCHPVKARCRPSDLPPAQTDRDSFGANFTHSKHLTLGTSIEKDCGYCHKAESVGMPALTVRPHAMCGGCHNANGAKPAITECQGCHTAPKGSNLTGGDAYRLRPFDHPAHTAASKMPPSCTGCHDKLVGATNESALPRPSMLNCQTKCHDGVKAFSATGTKCTQCHKGSEKPPALRQDQGFNHAAHEKRNVNINTCADCHAVEPDGTLVAPGTKKDHMPCAKSGCHQTEFLSRTPKICGICHDSAAPWAKNTSRPGPILALEWFETMNHQTHLKAAGGGSNNATCAGCHGDKLSAGAAPPRNHAACAKCHGKGQAPTMNDCAACHNRTKPSHAPVSQWAVTATFKHTQHAMDPRNRRATNCVECHSTVAASKDLASITAPKMSQCDSCHDGKTSFKTTGFGCARCHAPAGEMGGQPPATSFLTPASGPTAFLEPRARP
jgi:c(7)-type cytochrome triheme protein